MEFSIKSNLPEKQRSACIVVAIFEARKLSAAAACLNSASNGYISKILRKGDLEGKLGQSLLLHNIPNIPSDRILLLGCGKEKELGDVQYTTIIKTMINILNNTGCVEVACFIPECQVKNRDLSWKIKQFIITVEETLYTFNQYKSKNPAPRRPLQRMILNITSKHEIRQAEQSLNEGVAITKGLKYTKDLANTPPNICTPAYLAKAATKLAKDYKKISAAILNKKDLKSLGTGALLAVAQGSTQEPKLITLEYRGSSAKNAPVVLVGKGLTFDTGGNSLKSPTEMVGMKYDMCGAATVLGTLLFAAELEVPINIVGVIAAAENMPGGTACRPNDVIKSLSGATIEIISTDAEGRLVLSDALTYSERFKPAVVIDIATLTGACVIALGTNYSGLFSNYEPLAQDLITAGNMINDQCWQLPLAEEYQQQLNSKIADMKNVAGREGGSITAACFLSRFAKKFRWAHLDIAGTAWERANTDVATGRTVPLLAQYLLNYYKH